MPWKRYDEMSEGRRFPGKIVQIADEESEFTDRNTGKTTKRTQTHIQIKPLDHEVRGAQGTGCYHEWLSMVDNKQSKRGVWKKNLEDLEQVVNENEDLLNKCFIFEQMDLQFGGDKNPKIVTALVPVALCDESGAEIEEQKPKKPSFGKPAEVPTEEESNTEVPDVTEETPKPAPTKKPAFAKPKAAPIVQSFDYSGLEVLLKEGMERGQIDKWAQRKGYPKVNTNQFLEQLEKDGKLKTKEDSDGTIIYIIE